MIVASIRIYKYDKINHDVWFIAAAPFEMKDEIDLECSRLNKLAEEGNISIRYGYDVKPPIQVFNISDKISL